MHRASSILITVAAVLAAAAACPSSGGRTPACGLTSRDSTYLVRGPVYRDCAVDAPARLATPNVHPTFQPDPGDIGCLSADVEFVVDTTGAPEPGSARIVRATTTQFGEAVAAMVPSLRYEPARLGGVHVRQIVENKQIANLARVVVPAGSPPSRPSGAQHVPTC